MLKKRILKQSWSKSDTNELLECYNIAIQNSSDVKKKTYQLWRQRNPKRFIGITQSQLMDKIYYMKKILIVLQLMMILHLNYLMRPVFQSITKNKNQLQQMISPVQFQTCVNN